MGNTEQILLSGVSLFVINFLLGVWITLLAPLLFTKLGFVDFEHGENTENDIHSEAVAV